jgi:hypothetical protein
MNKLIGVRRSAAIGSATALAALAAAQPTPAATAPRACGVFTKALASTLIKEPPKAIVHGPLVCTYGRSSERASTMRTTLSFTIVANPSVAAARAVQRRLEQLAPRKQPVGMTGFVRGRVTAPNGETTYVYFRQAGGPIVAGFVFLRVGAYTAQLTPQVVAKAGRSFTAADLRTVAQRLTANLSRGG